MDSSSGQPLRSIRKKKDVFIVCINVIQHAGAGVAVWRVEQMVAEQSAGL